MAWKETDAMKERVKFLLAWEREWEIGEERVNMTALCSAFGIKRQTGYKWVGRYEAASEAARACAKHDRHDP